MIDFDNVLFNTDIESGTPHVGALLIAEPFLNDSYFARSVVCLIEYEIGKSAMGVVLNRKTRYSLQELLEEVHSACRIPVYCGGPMSRDRLYFIHRLGDIIPDSKEVSRGLYVGGQFGAMIDYINSGYPVDGNIRFFLGYSGWDPYQLDDEICHRVWAVSEIRNTKLLLRGDEHSFWHRYVRQLGDNFRGWRYHPSNPHAN